jgi:anti-sigma regulatory factor (Ser/Thr protein kinase)
VSIRRPFEPAAASVAAARRFVATTLADAGLDTPAILDPALVAVSELATNAVVHARTWFEVEVDTTPSVRITVIDRSAVAPELRRTEPWSQSGRGVAMVDATASRWGVEQEAGGKRVWWEVDLPEAI